MSKVIVTVVAISFITGLEVLAIHQGIDGLCLATAMALIGGLAGFKIGKLK